ncbi:cupin-like domain-containing protein [Fulvivirga sediminis]|uniref:Cupin-like domain-containing protein n=1 Tax=Fulvivirga sediminis TaxID=2803949 RepID=A0A937K283_9BACT|nr:cupin-like domain-containing protein [Fulvivirga sediminis]MBL3657522.1 cupin-like domain-containing protein [Fulvivirga sediminis]
MNQSVSIFPSEIAESPLDVEYNLSPQKFYSEYVSKNKPVIIKDMMQQWKAYHCWDESYFGNLTMDNKIVAKKGDVSRGELSCMTLKEYVQIISTPSRNNRPSHYLHDFPIFQIMPQLSDDIEPFPTDFLPKWYKDKWWNYICFFMGAENSFTPPHIDTLFTNNLFFQVKGYKEFTIVLAKDLDKCYMHKWKWSKVNLDKPNYDMYPLFKEVAPIKFHVGPGDILFMPAGTLHQVRGLTNSISFNIDWHTKQTVRKGIATALRKRAPRPNIMYNMLIASGLYLNIPSRFIFPYYKPYFSFIA